MKSYSINQRRWQIFYQTKRAYYALWLFTLISLISLLAPLIANDRPYLVYYQKQFYFPMWQHYPATTFGDIFPTEADYLDPYIINEINQQGWMIHPPITFSYDTHDTHINQPQPAPPSKRHPLGTDDQGRDIVARLLYGTQICLLFGLILTTISGIIGISIGAIQGYFGGFIDLIGQRIIEIFSGLPILYIFMILSSFTQPNFWTLLIIMLIFNWMGFVGYIRAEFFKARHQEYIYAAQAMGVTNLQIMWRHILPNATTATLTFLPWNVIAGIMSLTSLDFLGFGMPIGSASLGELMKQAKSNLQAPWIAISVFFTILVLLTSLIYIGEGLRNALDPKSKVN